MTTFSIFNTPAYQSQSDFNGEPSQRQTAFENLWSDFVNRSTKTALLGNPWNSVNDSPRSLYFNPMGTSIDESKLTPVPIQWNAFPNRINAYLYPTYGLTQRWQIADTNVNGLTCPANPCDPNSETVPFKPYGPRGWQDEYCEWAVTRVNDKITSVMFTCENPEYWFLLWNTDPNVVLKLYKQAFGISTIQLDDLCLYSEDGKKVIDPETGRPAYNPINKWNNGTATNFTDPSNPSGGAMHLTSPPNSLGAEVYLAAAATIQRYNGTKHITAADKLICCSQYGQPNRNSDPHIGQSVNLTIYNQGSTAIQATLLNPVGLYLQLPDSTAFNTVFSFPAKNNAPAGKTPMDCWKVTRGQANCPGYPNNAILHLVFEVPAEWGFTVGDMTMNYTSAQGEGYSGPVLYGAQLVELLQVQLCAVGIAATTPIQNLPCVASTTAANTLPSTNYLMDAGIYFASVNQYNQLNKFANLTPQILSVQRGTTRSNIVLQTNDADDTASISFGAGVQVTINSYTAATSVFLITIEVDKTAATGERDLTISMPGKPGIAAPCYLNITA